MEAFWESLDTLRSILESALSCAHFESVVSELYQSIDKAVKTNAALRCRILESAGYLGMPPKKVEAEHPVSIRVLEPERMHGGADSSNRPAAVSLCVKEILRIAEKNHISRISLGQERTALDWFAREHQADFYCDLSGNLFCNWAMEWVSIPWTSCAASSLSSQDCLARGELLTIEKTSRERFQVEVAEQRASVLFCQRETVDEYDNYLGVPGLYLLPAAAVDHHHTVLIKERGPL